MLTLPKLWHILGGSLTSIIYTAYIIQLLHPSDWVVVFLLIYYILLLIYILKTYAIFHYPPTQPNQPLPKLGNSIFQYKLTQERKVEVEQLLRLPNQNRPKLLEAREYLRLHRSPSFCDECENIQPSRAEHCLDCRTCIMGKHYHSAGIGFCIGQSNQDHYLSYLLISAMLLAYACLSLAAAQLLSSNFQKITLLQVIVLYCGLYIWINFGMYYGAMFLQLLACRQKGKTLIESKHWILGEMVMHESGNVNASGVLRGLVSFGQLGDVSAWISELESESEGQELTQ